MSPANVEAMAYYGETPWHGLGTQLVGVATAEEMIQAAGLDWTVSKRKIYVLDGQGYQEVKGKLAIVRDTDAAYYSMVTDAYQPLQNREAFKFFDNVVGEGKAIYHTAGSLDGGGLVWILAKLPQEIVVLGRDVTEEYLLLVNSHDGSRVVTVCSTSVRAVCKNTVMAAIGEAKNLYTVKHVGDFQAKFKQVAEMMGLASKYFDTTQQAYNAMVQVKMDWPSMRVFGEELFPLPTQDQYKVDEQNAEWLSATANKRRDVFKQLVVNGAGTEIPGVLGTLYGTYQAAVELADHHLHSYKSDNNKVKSIWFGEAVQVKQRAMDVAISKI